MVLLQEVLVMAVGQLLALETGQVSEPDRIESGLEEASDDPRPIHDLAEEQRGFGVGVT